MVDLLVSARGTILTIKPTCASPNVILELVKRTLQIRHPQAFFIKKRNRHLESWDGFVKFYQQQGGILTCGIGFLARLREAFAGEGLSCELVYEWPTPLAPQPPIEFADLLTTSLDESQVGPCRTMLSNSLAGVQLTTGSGKTITCANAIALVLRSSPDERAVFIVPRANLLHQTVRELRSVMAKVLSPREIGVIGDSEFDVTPGTRLAVGVANSVAAGEQILARQEILEWLARVTLLVIDEAHRSRSDFYKGAIANCPNATRLWALSGRFDSKTNPVKELEVESFFGKPLVIGDNEARQCPVILVAHEVSSWTNQLTGVSLQSILTDGCPVFIRGDEGVEEAVYRGPDALGKVPGWMLTQKGGRWQREKERYGIYRDFDSRVRMDVSSEDLVYGTISDFGIMEFGKRNRWAVDLAMKFAEAGERFIISVVKTAHLRRISELLTLAQVSHGQLHGRMTGAQQHKTLDRLAAGDIMGVVSNAAIISEGVNVVSLIHFIKLDGMTGDQLLTQQKGRIQRSAPGKQCGFFHIPLDGFTASGQATRLRAAN